MRKRKMCEAVGVGALEVETVRPVGMQEGGWNRLW